MSPDVDLFVFLFIHSVTAGQSMLADVKVAWSCCLHHRYCNYHAGQVLGRQENECFAECVATSPYYKSSQLCVHCSISNDISSLFREFIQLHCLPVTSSSNVLGESSLSIFPICVTTGYKFRITPNTRKKALLDLSAQTKMAVCSISGHIIVEPLKILTPLWCKWTQNTWIQKTTWEKRTTLEGEISSVLDVALQCLPW